MTADCNQDDPALIKTSDSIQYSTNSLIIDPVVVLKALSFHLLINIHLHPNIRTIWTPKAWISESGFSLLLVFFERNENDKCVGSHVNNKKLASWTIKGSDLLTESVINRSICFCLYNNYGPIFQDGLENGKFISLSRSGAGRGRQEQQLDPCSPMS